MLMDDDFTEEAEFLELYSIDDTLDSITRFERYHTSDFALQRLMLARELTDTAREAGHLETSERLVPLLSTFVTDPEPAVRQQLVDQLHPLAAFMIEGGDDARGYEHLKETFLPYAFEMLIDKNVEVGNAAVVAITKLVELVKEDQMESQVLSVVISLSRDERAEDYRVVASQLFNELAPALGHKLIVEQVVPEVIALSKDLAFMARKTMASNLVNIGKVLGPEEFVKHLLPAFITLSKDDIWGVRKACAETISRVSEIVPGEQRTSQLVEVFDRFADDVSRWVRVAAYQQLGPFIATFSKDELPSSLLKRYSEMATQRNGSGDTDMAECCAYSFPAVVQTVGADRWGELDSAFTTLSKDVQWKVRRMLSHALHELAAIIGRENSQKTLTDAFDLFLRDLDEVKVGVVSNAPEFLAVLGEEQRDTFIPQVCQVPAEGDNWRVRSMVASILGRLAALLSPAKCSKCLLETELKLLDDSVIEVRRRANKSGAILLQHLYGGSDDDHKPLLEFIKQKAERPNYQDRLQFVYIAGEILELEADQKPAEGKEPTKIFETEMRPLLCQLTTDKVPNVRLALAKTIAKGLKATPDDAELKKAQSRLTSDQDQDVLYFASQEE